MGLLSVPLTLVRAQVRLSLRVAELGLSTAAEAARIGTELLNRDREPPPPDFPQYRSPAEPDRSVVSGAAGPPEVEVEVEPVEADAPPSIPDELIPDHIDEEPVLVAAVAEEGAEDGAGAELTVEQPWDGYHAMTAASIRDRLAAATAAEAAAVELYESTHKNRRSVMDAAARALRG